MCGILAIFGIGQGGAEGAQDHALKLAKRIRHRGPDWSGLYCKGSTILAHERLSIVGVDSGAQPIYSADETVILAVNGEIYNHKALEAELKQPHEPFSTTSDCEVILKLYQEQGSAFLNKLNGIFAFALFDESDGSYLIARDHMGICPLYYGWGKDGSLYVASELKAIHDSCVRFQEFPPGHFFSSRDGELQTWYKPVWHDVDYIPTEEVVISKLREELEAAVHRQMMCEVPYGLLLSGGLDSSLISAITARKIKQQQEAAASDPHSRTWFPQLHSFSIGLDGSPDLIAAQKVADYIGSVHHSFTFTIEEGLRAISDVIYHLETFDVTTVRASTPMYLLSRKIKAMGIKMVLSGEGADEIFGGYLYFHKAPNKEEFHKETVRKLKDLHMYDCLRANKSTAAWGVEARVPFLDKEFLDFAMTFDPKDKLIQGERKEKWVLRKAFEGYLPEEILWRQKEQFSDGVGYSWIDSLRDKAGDSVSDEMFKSRHFMWPEDAPATKEGYYYRQIFESHFPEASASKTVPTGPSIACSTPTAIEWDEAFKNMADPSGRAVKGIHDDAYTSLEKKN